MDEKKVTIGLHAKLMIARTELRSGKDAKNNYAGYDYRNAERMLSAIKPVLQRHDLTLDFSDEVVMVGARYYVKTTLTIYDVETGETHQTQTMAREQDTKKGSDEAQVTGGSITYAHKYALMAAFAISDPALDPDARDNRQTPAPGPVQQAPTMAPGPVVTAPAPAPAPAQYQPAPTPTYNRPTQYGRQTYQQYR